MSQQTLRLGVLGAGRIGKIHIENLANRIPGAEVVALADVFPEELAAVAAGSAFRKPMPITGRCWSFPRWMRWSSRRPPTRTTRMILDAAAAGKHIFCEKPIDLALERIAEINRAVALRGVQLMVGFNRRFDPNFRKVHEMVRAGRSASRKSCASPAATPRRLPKPTSALRAASSWI